MAMNTWVSGSGPLSIHDDYEARCADPGDMEHIRRLFEIASSYEYVRVLELGVRTGMSTSAFLAAAARTGGHVWSVDVEQPRVPASWEQSGLWTLTVADDLGELPGLHGMRFDVLFIDTSHSLAHTLAELERFVPLTVPGGRVLLHDSVMFPGVREALDAFCPLEGLSWAEWGGKWGMGEIAVPHAVGA